MSRSGVRFSSPAPVGAKEIFATLNFHGFPVAVVGTACLGLGPLGGVPHLQEEGVLG
jgi:hypothetical protein